MKNRLGLLISFATLLFAASLAFAQTPDFSGTWAGPMTTDSGPGGLEITLMRDGAEWKAGMKLRIEGQEIASAVKELKVNEAEIFFAADLDRSLVKFKGKFVGDKLSGTVEAFQGERRVGQGTFTLTRGGQMPALQRGTGWADGRSEFRRKSG